jgi:hypothetical protein
VFDAIALNATAALLVAGLESDAQAALECAVSAMQSGAARCTLARWAELSRSVEVATVKIGHRLDPILSAVRRRLAERRREITLAELRRSVRPDPSRSERFVAGLRAPGLSVIAECKRASPSAGQLSEELDWLGRANAYARGGAAALSVLTERDHFFGAPEHLAEARVSGLPLLRKDFVLDESMVLESALWGADAILLLPVALDDARLRELYDVARTLGPRRAGRSARRERARTRARARARVGRSQRAQPDDLRGRSVGLRASAAAHPPPGATRRRERAALARRFAARTRLRSGRGAGRRSVDARERARVAAARVEGGAACLSSLVPARQGVRS